MKQALLLGDYKLATWHPLKGVDDQIVRILDFCQTDVCEEYPSLTPEQLLRYDVVVNYIDAWGKRGNADCAGAMLSFVASGGAMLSVHNGIIMHNHPEMEQLMCARFDRHPKHETLRYTISESHPITKASVPFEMDEEPYMFTMSGLFVPTMLMEYEYQGERYPAAWLRTYGRGKMVYLAPGHNAESFQNAGFETLLRNSAVWCCGE